MDFAFSDGVPLGGECRRVAGEEVEAAISRLTHFHEDPDIAIHEVRKHNKRIRSVLLLSGSALDPDDLARTNRLVRDAARLFSGARDAFVLQDTCDKLAARFPEDAGDMLPLLREVRDTFAERHAACLHDRELPGKIARACDDFREAGESIARWDWEQVTREEIFGAILSHYQRGVSDFETARRSRDPEDCHDWRKRTKALSYHLTLLAPLDAEGKEGNESIEQRSLDAGELASSLGEHHDLAVFEEAVGEGVEQGIFPGAARLLPALAPDIDRHRPVNRLADPFPIKRSEQIATVGITEKRLVGGMFAQPRYSGCSDAICAVAAFGKPDCVESRVVGTIKKCIQTHFVAACKMPLLDKALLVKRELYSIGCRSNLLHARGILVGNRRGGRTNGNPEHAP